MKEGSTVISTYTYNPNGSLEKQDLPNSISANYTYFKNNKLKTLTNKSYSQPLESYQYTYDGAGNMTAKFDVKSVSSNLPTLYTYTPINQLLTVAEPDGKLTAYTYDNAGNRLSEIVTENSQTTITNYTLNDQNRLMQTEQVTTAQTIIEQYFYDNAGNMLGRSPEALTNATGLTGSLGISLLGQTEETDLTPALYSYNDKNQMIEAVNGESIVTNTFNAEGLRYSKTVDGVTTYYCYEYSRVIKEVDSTGSVAYNIYGTNLISRDLDGNKAYYIYNGHGDVTGLISSSGTIIASYYYDAFGNIVEESGNFGNPYRYAGYIYDEQSKLYNLNARFYDAKIARFMQEDAYLGSQTDPLSLNLYTYCSNNPVRYSYSRLESRNSASAVRGSQA